MLVSTAAKPVEFNAVLMRGLRSCLDARGAVVVPFSDTGLPIGRCILGDRGLRAVGWCATHADRSPQLFRAAILVAEPADAVLNARPASELIAGDSPTGHDVDDTTRGLR